MIKISGGPFIISRLNSPAERLRLSVVIPTYNESRNINDVIVGLSGILNDQLSGNYEIIVVDDNSPDQTWKIVQELLPRYSQLKLVRRVDERGLSSAVIRGWQVSQGEYLGVMDGDLQHPVTVMGKLAEVVSRDRDVDLVVASRNIKGGGVSEWHAIRRMVSRGAQMLGLIFISGVFRRVSDPMSGCFIVRRDVIAQRTLKPIGYKVLLEIMAKGRIQRIKEVGYIFQERKTGSSKMGAGVYMGYIAQLIQICLYRFQTRFKSRDAV